MARTKEKKPTKVRKDETIQIRLTADQKRTLTAAAAKIGLGIGPWLLMHGLKAAAQGG